MPPLPVLSAEPEATPTVTTQKDPMLTGCQMLDDYIVTIEEVASHVADENLVKDS